MIFNYVNPAHKLFNDQIQQIVFVIISKIIRSQDALSISPFLVIDDNTIHFQRKMCVSNNFERNSP
jgi:hypothetical protein